MNEEVTLQKQESGTPDGAERTRERKVYVPHVDIFESEGGIVLLADMPGVDEKGIDITIEKNVLTLKGTASVEPPAGYTLAYAEYGIGDYERVFTISNEVDRDNVQASVKNGVLRLTLPKAKHALAKKVTVVAG
jgi:HSP20 family molecular chaperone IbpA